MNKEQSKKYMNPYMGGVLLGLVLLTAFYFSGRGLGASGAVKSAVVAGVETVAPAHAEASDFYTNYKESHSGGPLKDWLVWEMLGVLVGGFVSGAIAGRLKFKVEHSPKITSKTRLIFAALGGILFGFGSQLGRGCTSGSALSGMAVLSLGGFITMAFIFGTAFALAYFARKLWI
ncbi:YeeE/YedE family protein [Carboxylicivirga mesophila]|uniref:YeeE/YedE family protein n=2 Tax=Carboxylicivirga TaxID=1628153 RepID=A0A941F4Z7_9BACT|nr:MULTISPECIES: YeeE/YedE thiosulfate transporter family protein [Carboxylicivirga]MBR8535325.1 YeeE/YedE family protein [Carboxylicivirga sediminis]MBS2210892.1 YeeE/YedE family protein [Carboxylicivirga mesophila]